MPSFALISEAALDNTLTSGGFSPETMLPQINDAVYSFDLNDHIMGYRVANEPIVSYFALISLESIAILTGEGGSLPEIYRRIARVVKGLRSPPVHLPRQWLEYHYKNLLAFFALSRDVSSIRWIVDIDSQLRCVRFDYLSPDSREVKLTDFIPSRWPAGLSNSIVDLLGKSIPAPTSAISNQLAHEVDLQAIGSASVVSGRTYEQWQRFLSVQQQGILETPVDTPIRIVGPAGSGKTLSLCMRALRIARDENVIGQGKRVLIATHSWAMSERIDSILIVLNGGVPPPGIFTRRYPE